MTDATADTAEGRPQPGEQLKASLAIEAARRGRQRDLRPLRHLAPFVRAHWTDAGAAIFFLLLSTGASLGLTGAARLVVDKGFGAG